MFISRNPRAMTEIEYHPLATIWRNRGMGWRVATVTDDFGNSVQPIDVEQIARASSNFA